MKSHPFLPRRRGVSAIEFAMWLPILILFVSAVVDWGYYMTRRVALSRGVMEGCRAGSTIFEPSSVTPVGSLIRTKAQARTTLILHELGIECPSASCDLSVSYCSDGDTVCGNPAPPFDALQVNAELDFTPFFGWIPIPSVINESFVMAAEHQR